MTEPLSSWNWGQAKDDIIRFVERTCGEGTAKAVTVEERIAVFENDGTLWCEKPMPVLVDDILCGSSRWCRRRSCGPVSRDVSMALGDLFDARPMAALEAKRRQGSPLSARFGTFLRRPLRPS